MERRGGGERGEKRTGEKERRGEGDREVRGGEKRSKDRQCNMDALLMTRRVEEEWKGERELRS